MSGAVGVLLLAVAFAYLATSSSRASAPAAGASKFLENIQAGKLSFAKVGRMSFGPDGLLLVADRGNGSVVGIDTGDVGPPNPLKKRVNNVGSLLAKALGTTTEETQIVDMAVNPKSGLIYFSIIRMKDGHSVILTMNNVGKIGNLDLAKARHVRITLPGDGKDKVSNVTSVEFASDRVLAAGQSGREFSSKIYSIPLPLKHGDSAAIYSTETYHVAHGQWETRAPIQSFTPIKEGDKTFVVGSFSCTPIAKFPVDGLESGAKIKGTSVVELGSGNRPVDMFTYKKDGKSWLVTNTDRFHHKRRPIGPSQYWGCRVDLQYLGAEDVNEKAARRVVDKPKGPSGMEVVPALFGVKQIDQFDNDAVVVLRENDGRLDVEPIVLP